MSDKFPEAFERFERAVDTRCIENLSQLVSAFASLAGYKWLDSSSQRHALARELEGCVFLFELI